ncbi:hypothetical protein ACFRK5_05825 [Streptomyces niveus]|uniref:hypothetical protein n=1 Tax=Streptomyces niveus TaxID=193462 RepID=UPI0036CBE4D2
MNGQYGPVPGNPYAQPQPQPAPQPVYAQPPAYAPSYAQPPAHHNPEFLAADSRSGIVVDENGVTFDFEGQSAEFPWSEIQSIHSKPGAGGHRLMVAVVLPGGKFYECGVKARNSVTLNHWFRDLGHVLGVYLGRRDNPPLSHP